LAIAAAAIGKRRERSPIERNQQPSASPRRRPALALVLWTAATLVIWCVIMFGPYATAIHQGSYVTMLVLFVLGCAWFERAGRWWIVAVAVLQVATFISTWAWPNAHVHGPLTGWPWLAIAVVALAGAGMTFAAKKPFPKDNATPDDAWHTEPPPATN
jgi:hypothetical protein